MNNIICAAFMDLLNAHPVVSVQTCALAKNQGPRSSRSRVKYTFQDPGFPRSHVKYRGSWGNAEAEAKPKIAIAPT